MINQILEQLGFHKSEAEVYLAILKLGKSNPASIAKITGINRTTVYSIVEKLIKKGVITRDLAEDTTSILALAPSDLNMLAQREEKKVEEKKQLIKQAVVELKKISKQTKYPVPRIVFIPEEDIEDYLYKQLDAWNNSIHEADGIWWGFQDHTLVGYYNRWVHWSWEQDSMKGILVYLLTNKSEIEEAMKEHKYPRRKMKFWNENVKFTATTWVGGDYVIMIMTNQRPYYLVEIHDSVLAHNLRELFKGIWNTIEG